MSFFNTKQKKSYTTTHRKTLDAKHNEMLISFNKQTVDLDEIKENHNNNIIEYNELSKIKKCKLTDDELNRTFFLEKEIKKNTEKIHKIENNEYIVDYYLKTSDILSNYYDNINNIANKSKSKCQQSYNSKINNIPNNTMEDYVSKSYNFKRADHLDKYLKLTDIIYTPTVKYDTLYNICKNCNIEMIVVQIEAILVCDNCGNSNKIIIDSNKPNYKDPPPEISYFAYKRINHFLLYWSVITGTVYNLLVLKYIKLIY
jgi:hypothetical protein